MNRAQADKERREQEAISEFEAIVEHTMEYGALTRKNALLWIAEGEQFNGDWDYVCYRYGLPYGYFEENK